MFAKPRMGKPRKPRFALKRSAVCAIAAVIALVFAATFALEGCAQTAASTSSGQSASDAKSSQAESDLSSNSASPMKATGLIVQSDPDLYTYEDLEKDVEALAKAYPQWVKADSLGTTVDGRKLHHLVIGNPDASNKVLITGGIHAREYMTTQLVMKQLTTFLEHAADDESYGRTRYRDVLSNTAIHVVPSVNPDGAAISQRGLDAAQTDAVRNQLLEIAALDERDPNNEYFTEWKANANGVDLNRQFDAMWDDYSGTPHPSSDHYKGTAPGSEIESKALIDLTESQRFSRTISYHTHGSVVYWYFAQTGSLYDDTLAFAEAIGETTGYELDANYEALDPAGYKDWAIQSMGIPSLTIEVGLGSSPVPPEQFPVIWTQNEHVWETTLNM